MTKRLRIIGLLWVLVAITLRALPVSSTHSLLPDTQRPVHTPVVSMPLAAPFAVEQQESIQYAPSSIQSSRQLVKQYIYGIYAGRLFQTHVQHTILQTCCICVGLPRARIAYPFHSFW